MRVAQFAGIYIPTIYCQQIIAKDQIDHGFTSISKAILELEVRGTNYRSRSYSSYALTTFTLSKCYNSLRDSARHSSNP